MLIAIAVLPGCASTETVRQAQGQGVSRTFPYGHDRVHKAVLASATAKGLEVTEDDAASGRVVLSHGVTWLSWGERIAVFIKAATATSTQVEIVSKPVMSPLNFPPDWQQILIDDIDARLRTGP